jgi:hypothetical protein
MTTTPHLPMTKKRHETPSRADDGRGGDPETRLIIVVHDLLDSPVDSGQWKQALVFVLMLQAVRWSRVPNRTLVCSSAKAEHHCSF